MTPLRSVSPLLLAVLSGCSANAPNTAIPPPPTASSAAAAPASAAAAPVSASAAAPHGDGVSARATAVGVSPESIMYRRVKVAFSNPTARACAFTAYTLHWGAFSKKLDLDGFSVPPGQTRERWAKVNPDDSGYAELEKIDVAQISVEVKSDCPVSAAP
jgi:hypothetical protein